MGWQCKSDTEWIMGSEARLNEGINGGTRAKNAINWPDIVKALPSHLCCMLVPHLNFRRNGKSAEFAFIYWSTFQREGKKKISVLDFPPNFWFLRAMKLPISRLQSLIGNLCPFKRTLIWRQLEGGRWREPSSAKAWEMFQISWQFGCNFQNSLVERRKEEKEFESDSCLVFIRGGMSFLISYSESTWTTTTIGARKDVNIWFLPSQSLTRFCFT